MNPDGGRSAARPVILGSISQPRAIPSRRGGGGRVAFRSVEERIARLDARFQEALAAFDVQIQLAQSLQASDPQLVLVFEALDEQIDLSGVAQTLGFEVLTEVEDSVEESDEFVLTAANPRNPLISSCLHAICLNQQSFDQLRTLWGAWKSDRTLRYGLSPLRDLFQHLRDVRPWGPVDRLKAIDWDQYFDGLIPDQLHTIEIELWFRESTDRRQRAEANTVELISQAGGEFLTSVVIPEVGYHGIKCKVPLTVLRQLADGEFDEVQLVTSADVMYLRISAQAIPPASDETDAEVVAAEDPTPQGAPILCVLDGLPEANHPLLDGRVIIHDPDDLGSGYTVERQKHGTWMTSIAIWGDRSSAQNPTMTPVLVRPILVPSAETTDGSEELPSYELVPDLMQRIFRELFEDTDGRDAAAPQVTIINLSVGDPSSPFESIVSSWARILDWLSYEYGVLIVVAAGNHPQLHLTPATSSDVVALKRDERRRAVLDAEARSRNLRRLLAPAESINAITIGALHADNSNMEPTGYVVDPFDGLDGVSPVSALGPGYRRSVKPDLVAMGGRAVFRHPDVEPATVRFRPGSSLGPGMRVASPSAQRETFICGTSAAAALTSHYACRLNDLVDGITSEISITRRHRAAAIKALLIHGCSDLDGFETESLPTELLLGNGVFGRDLSQGCATNEAVLLFFGTIGASEEQDLILPLPDGLGVRETKRIDTTLAWLSPVNWRHRQYRRAALSFVKPEGAIPTLGKASGLSSDAATRGATTVQHQTWLTDSAFASGVGSAMTVRVKCYEQAGGLQGERIDYAAALSLWVAPTIEVDVYSQVREQVQARVTVQST
ncbi:S8 family peptidase [Mycolicibacterium novocastrense]|uniref:S8 family peptidase n=1 Tax=Mycolicibacterium novocastrense TaxID=59813 RepID=A0AAW5SKD0_MYCNV|nr:S8 family peptidase [Mycolicibacterium novocastrense]